MERSEVLDAVNWAAEVFDELVANCTDDNGRAKWDGRATALRAAAELIRAGGWRPIADAPESKWLFVGKHALGEWYPATLKKSWAIANGYTHYLPDPEPPAREVPNERG